MKWRAYEFIYYPKTSGWYLVNLLIVLTLILFALWQKNFLLIIFLVIAEILVLVWANREPKELEFELNDKGIRVENNLQYYFNDLEGFAIKENEDLSEIFILQKTKFRPVVKIPLPKGLTFQVRNFMLKFLPEKEIEESFLDSLSKIIGF